MPHLFSPITIARTKLKNRIVAASLPSGYTALDGFVPDELVEHYARYACGGVGLIITEPVRVLPPARGQSRSHIGIYSDLFIPSLRRITQRVHENTTRIVLLIDAPPELARADASQFRKVAEAFMRAAWRALGAGFDGVMLSGADGGILHHLISPLMNRRSDEYGHTIDGRLHLPLTIIEGIHQWLGPGFLIGFRLVADEFTVGGLTLQDARVVASRVVGSGASFLDVTADLRGEAVQIARFPGWCVPLVSGIKRFLPDTPVIGSGLLDEPYLADSVVRDGSLDMVMVGDALSHNPEWPHLARSFLLASGG